MNAFSSFLLGLVQGVAEFLPISSSGHLAIAQNLLHIDAEVPEFFDVLLHLGTLGAVFVAYWKDIKDMIAEFFRGIGDLAHRSTPKPLPPARHKGLSCNRIFPAADGRPCRTSSFRCPRPGALLLWASLYLWPRCHRWA